ncbi:MAG: calcium-binding protein [Cypionkella sp.]|uniref:calcium-binding protein n=1 Tax=Cypionkella sp. TaxID=2811411 RepID=UPI002ABB2AE6|nr:calcium-binding protein [Cypionkella sp.]MDZ4311856.1 calcium-binding protein [Cypionkella sp.]
MTNYASASAASTLTAADGIRDAARIAAELSVNGSQYAALQFSDDAYGRAAAAEFRRIYVTQYGHTITIELFVPPGHVGYDATAVLATMAARGGDATVFLTSDVAFGKAVVMEDHYAGAFSQVWLAPQLYDLSLLNFLPDAGGGNPPRGAIHGTQLLDLAFGPQGQTRSYVFDKAGAHFGQVVDLNGAAKYQYLEGDAASQLLSAPGGAIIIKAGDGADTVRGSGVGDYLSGDSGNDLVSGGLGNDTLLGDSGNDKLEGGFGSDQLYGGTGHDVIFGGATGDFLYGQEGDDRLIGEGGNDRLSGGAGSDVLRGALGADRFVFSKGFGKDWVADFTTSDADRLMLSQTLWAETLTASQVVSRYAHVVAGNVALDFGNGDVFILVGMTSTAGLAGWIDIL